MTVSLPVVSLPKVLIANIFIALTVIPLTPSYTNLSFWLPSQSSVTVLFMSVRHLLKRRTILFVCF